MKQCPKCGHYNGTRNLKCTQCNKSLKNEKKFEKTKIINGKSNKFPILRILFYFTFFIGLVIFIFSIPSIYAEMKKSDEEKQIDKTLSKDEKNDLELYIDRAENFLEEEEYKNAYDDVQKALKINKESTSAKEIKEEVLPYMDRIEIDTDSKIISSTKTKVKEYYFEQAIQDLKTVEPKLKYSKKENPYYKDAQKKINYVLLKKGEYLESAGKTGAAIEAYNRMNPDYKYFNKAQANIEDIYSPKNDSKEPGFFSGLFGSFKKTDEEKAAYAAEKKAKEEAEFQARINQSKSVDYDELERAPGRFKDTPVSIEGEVYDIQEINGKTLISMLAYDKYGEKHSVVALYHDKTSIKEGHYISIYADVLGGYSQYRNKIADYLDDPYYIYYESGSKFHQAPVVEIFYMNANGVGYR